MIFAVPRGSRHTGRRVEPSPVHCEARTAGDSAFRLPARPAGFAQARAGSSPITQSMPASSTCASWKGIGVKKARQRHARQPARMGSARSAIAQPAPLSASTAKRSPCAASQSPSSSTLDVQFVVADHLPPVVEGRLKPEGVACRREALRAIDHEWLVREARHPAARRQVAGQHARSVVVVATPLASLPSATREPSARASSTSGAPKLSRMPRTALVAGEQDRPGSRATAG